MTTLEKYGALRGTHVFLPCAALVLTILIICITISAINAPPPAPFDPVAFCLNQHTTTRAETCRHFFEMMRDI